MKKHFITILTLLFTIIFSVASFAAPVNDIPTVITQPDGTEISCLASGDEYFNFIHDENGYIIKQADDGWYEYCLGNDEGIVTSGVRVGEETPKDALTKDNVYQYASSIIDKTKERYSIPREYSSTSSQKAASDKTYFTGDFNNIVIFVCFSDESTTLNSYLAENMPKIYNEGYQGSSGPKSSVKEYFNSVTNGKINLTTTFYPTKNGTICYYQDNHPRSYYQPYSSSNSNGYSDDDESTSREFTLLQNVVQYVQTIIPSDLNLDKNNDGEVDSITFIISGQADGWSDLLWSHKWAIYNRVVNLNNKRVYTFSFTMLSHIYYGGSLEMGTICHEMMHTFGMPDLYDYVNQYNEPIGSYDVMASTNSFPQLPTVYTRERWGIYESGKSWVYGQTREITSGIKQQLTLQTSSSNEGIIAYKIPYSLSGYYATNTKDGAGEKTIYIEYRGASGKFDTGVSTGLLVYETDSNISDNTRNSCIHYSTLGDYLIDNRTKDCYTIWAYRKSDTSYTTEPTAFKEGSGDIFINLSNGAILKISNIDEADDKSTVTFDIEIFVNGDPTYEKTTDGYIISEIGSASTLTSNLSKQYISWNSDSNCKYFNGTPKTNTKITMTILDKNGNKVKNTANVGTGYKVQVTSNASSLNKNIDIVVYGDLDGNASIDVNDMILLKKHLSSETGILNGAALYAANMDRTTGLTNTDLASLANKILSSAK